ncbi:thiamine phosphate synthase [Mechercharimyces sp. CAU 1602]|uniref:thiamine phosphate synthase n=1 Tax=Mechercharimyces sp. CAU 1602 TaxID=2973933 RepID=UPI0021622721|nr:thiamine phosphate synthase [Mechercharimyces sp. CAU 1602]MCS1351561.1 thiamine phosphate synthase [Mechercharimyces sp. CAU 1602]
MTKSNILPSQLHTYLVMGSQDCQHASPLTVLEEAIHGGITCFQFREKGSLLPMKEIVELGTKLRMLCSHHHIPFFVNDRIDLALTLEADGVHVGQTDLPAAAVRQLIGSKLIMGVSVSTPAEAEQAQLDGADYLGIGPMYTTFSKQDAREPLGPDAIPNILATLDQPLPTVGIGGITVENAANVRRYADGVAVISAITASQNPRRAATHLNKS